MPSHPSKQRVHSHHSNEEDDGHPSRHELETPLNMEDELEESRQESQKPGGGHDEHG